MAALTRMGRYGFANQIVGVLKENQADIKKAGVDVAARLKEIDDLTKSFNALEASYEKAVVEKRNASQAANDALSSLYGKASATVELVIGAVGKESKLAGRLRNMRDAMALEALRGKKQAGGS
jgi:hypothetical protein